MELWRKLQQQKDDPLSSRSFLLVLTSSTLADMEANDYKDGSSTATDNQYRINNLTAWDRAVSLTSEEWLPRLQLLIGRWKQENKRRGVVISLIVRVMLPFVFETTEKRNQMQ
ncbi:unnamed protein product [Linum tenue]|uniref:Uncharacterized protein n=1 Tax=Linum tenue TaxID=586396 RepID=A0AAV0Q0W3_9ROSI|nr:unnamed protein product [Linum tenue]